MSNANPLLAKLALDNEAKKTKNMRANWSYQDVENKVWNIPNLTDFWGIGERTARRLQKLYIYSVRDLANADPDILKSCFEKWRNKLQSDFVVFIRKQPLSPYI